MTRMRAAVAAVVVLVVAVVAAVVVQVPKGPSATELREQLGKAAPLGSTAKQVEEVASQLGMEHSKYRENDRTVTAMLREVKKGLFSETSLYVQFHFDQNGKLERFSVEEVGTSL